MLEKYIKDLDLYIHIIDEFTNKYVCGNDVDCEWKLWFSFEDWTDIYNDGREHQVITAYYKNKDGMCLTKWQDESFDILVNRIKTWNEAHRIINKNK